MAVAVGQLAELQVRDLSGGLNVRDSADEVAPNELVDAWNATLDERGGAGSRLGYAKYNSNAFAAALVKNGFKWASGNHLIWQCGSSVYLDTSTTAFKTFSTADRVGFADFLGKLIIIHPVDGLFVSDGTSGGTSRAVAGPKGNVLAVWQNRLWAADGATPTVWFSAIGSATQWFSAQTTTTGSHTLPVGTINAVDTSAFTASGSLTITDGTNTTVVAYTGKTATTFTGATGGTGTFAAGSIIGQNAVLSNDLREKDGEGIVCLTGAAGLDISGRPGLLAFKKRSAYRIYDSATGAYQTIDPKVGAASALAAVTQLGRTYTISEAGIFWTDGVGPMRNEGDKLRPLWSASQLAYDQLALWCAGRRGDRVHFSVPRAGSTANDLALEHQPAARPADAATMPGSNAASCYVADGPALYGGSPSVNGQTYLLYSGGTDDGTAIHAWCQTRWVPLNAGNLARVRRLRVKGRGAFSVIVRRDYETMGGDSQPFALDQSGIAVYDVDSYDDVDAVYGPTVYEGATDFYSLGVARWLSLRLEATTSALGAALQLLGAGTAPPIGAWAVYGFDLFLVPLSPK